jgi:hypothetical protein
MKLSALAPILTAAAARDWQSAADACDAIAQTENPNTRNGWHYHLTTLARVLRTGTPHYSIFKTDGNSKLPFVAFSALPGKDFCPGAGDCLKWCYSFRAWRYPAAFARQVQNTFLLSTVTGRAFILHAFDTVSAAMHERGTPNFTARIYVDGDFRDESDVTFWAFLMRRFPQVDFYGYSKSFAVLLAADARNITLPSNYLLNLSGGHNADADTLAGIRTLPYVRGDFKAVSIGRKVRNTDHGTRETNSALRTAYGAKAFTCPGKCGSCTPRGHACGSTQFKGVDIIIAVH